MTKQTDIKRTTTEAKTKRKVAPKTTERKVSVRERIENLHMQREWDKEWEL
ncbi:MULTISPECIES: hypothetical protein [unclassified Photobacterium]|uniref:hypothetical protein n=1 Tax=unclassified Photobacterium TaxID=2628852 RepID=UPI0018ED79D1|nr:MULTISPECIES: hypothetical protein [unclassified Photobacterium]